jgi:hypothetical membrane protein
VSIIFILPWFSFEGYSVAQNSISQLGGQNHPYNWIMNVFGFMLMGVGIMFLYAKVPLTMASRILILTFGFCMTAVGFFQCEPVVGYGVANVFESNMHSLIANIMGIAVTLFAVSLLFDKKFGTQYRVVAFMAATISSLFSLGMVMFPDYYGLIQRLMFIFILSWLYYVAYVKQVKFGPKQLNN